MKKHTLTLAALAVASFGWISIAAAQPPEGGPRRGGPGGPGFGPGGGGGAPVEMIAERLGLSDDQKAQWKAIHEKARVAGEPLMKAERAAHEAFDKALNSDNADPAAVGQAALAMKSAQQKVEAQHKATLDEAKAILTPEQAAKLDEMEKHMRRQGPGGFGPGGPDGQGPRRRPGQGSK
jgi:Spy/CpxP family protein refolding chaperone